MFPEKVKIGWKTYDIRIANEVLNGGDKLYGKIAYNDLTITLHRNNTPEQSMATLIHEILHGIDDMYDLDLKEQTIRRLGNALYTFLTDNNLASASYQPKPSQ
jgi:hypothetical protein